MKQSPILKSSYPLKVFKNLPIEKQDEIVSDLIMLRVRCGDETAAHYLRDHPRLRVIVSQVNMCRLGKLEAQRFGYQQRVSLDFWIGLNYPKIEQEWDTKYLNFDLDIVADKQNCIQWQGRSAMCPTPFEKLLPVFLGDWITRPRKLNILKPGAVKRMISKDTEMKLGEFSERLQHWKHWEEVTP